MPKLERLHLHHFRNFSVREFALSPGVNLLSGPNGAGKTSVLEAIFFLAYGKSFRAKELNRLITEGQSGFTLYAEGETEAGRAFQLGMQRGGRDPINRINGETVQNLNPFAQCLPLILLHPESFQLLNGGARYRRQLMDWGVFYHEPQSHAHYAVVRKALKQRNQALKMKARREEVRLWETTCIKSCEALDVLRAQYINTLSARVAALLGSAFIDTHEIIFEYDRGWNKDTSLPEIWDAHFAQDQRSGHSEKGPHQADIKVIAGGKPAKDRLSRGQQKLLISMLKLAQGLLLGEEMGATPIYLFDDLSSELDAHHRAIMSETLLLMDAQILISGVEPEPFLGPALQIFLGG